MQRLNVAKSVITVALDRLTELGFVRRGPDPSNASSVLVQRTRRGNDFLGELRGLLAATKPL